MMLVLWVANMLQHPEKKSLCLVLLSAEGVGKSIFTRLLQMMVGKTKTLRTSSPENSVCGRFNSLMIGKFIMWNSQRSLKLTCTTSMRRC